MARGIAWGDIRLVEFGKPDRTRPALVLTRTGVISRLSSVTVAPITRTIRGIPTEVGLGTDNGLKVTSVANFDSLQTVGKERIGRYLGSVGAQRRSEVREALLFAFDLEE